MKQYETIFDLMDAWRHFPNYQLERRADLFFSLYLPEVLEAKLGFPVAAEIVPEFPVRIGTIYPNIPIDKSYKIDYFVLSADTDKGIWSNSRQKECRDVPVKTSICSRLAGWGYRHC